MLFDKEYFLLHLKYFILCIKSHAEMLYARHGLRIFLHLKALVFRVMWHCLH